MADDNLKVFISWSKSPTDRVADGFRKLLLHMFDNVTPWLSGEIEGGSLGVPQIHGQLASTSFGVVVVTKRNQREPWLNYEAGSLSKTVTAQGRVIPLLIDMNSPVDMDPGPLKELQARVADEDGVRQIVSQIAGLVAASEKAVESRWPVAWQLFNIVLGEARRQMEADPNKVEERSERQMLEELLEISRSQRSSYSFTGKVDHYANLKQFIFLCGVRDDYYIDTQSSRTASRILLHMSEKPDVQTLGRLATAKPAVIAASDELWLCTSYEPDVQVC